MSITVNANGETFSFEDDTDPNTWNGVIEKHFADKAAQQTAQNPPAPVASQAAPCGRRGSC